MTYPTDIISDADLASGAKQGLSTPIHHVRHNNLVAGLAAAQTKMGKGAVGVNQDPSAAGMVGRVPIVMADGTTQWLLLPVTNTCPNGGMEIWSYVPGTSIAVPASTNGIAGYGPDQWNLKTNANQASVIDRVAGLTDGSQYAARVRRNSGQTGTSLMVFERAYGTDEIVRLRNGYISLTATLQAGANWSPASGNLTVLVACGTGTEGRRGAGFTAETALINQQFAVAAGGAKVTARYTSSVVVPANATQMSISWQWTPVGTAGAADDISIDDVMIVPGTVPLPFIQRPDDIRECMRWWEVFGEGVLADILHTAYNAASTGDGRLLSWEVTKRTTPVVTKNGTWTATNCSQPTFTFPTKRGVYMSTSVTALGGYTYNTNSADDYVTVDSRFT